MSSISDKKDAIGDNTFDEYFSQRDLDQEQLDQLYPSASMDAYLNDNSGLLCTDKEGDPWYDWCSNKQDECYKQVYKNYSDLHRKIYKLAKKIHN